MSSRAIHFLPFLTPCTRPSSFPFPPLALNPHSAQPLPALAGRTNLASALRARLGSASSSAAPSSSSSTSGSRSHDTSYGLNHLQRKRPSSPFAASRAFTTAAQLAQQIGNANPAEMGAIATGRVDTTARVQKLREALKQEKLDA